MKTVTKPIYYCDGCNKRMLKKHSMELHEKHCLAIKANQVKCLDCKHSESFTDLEGITRFWCNAKRIKIHTPKAEVVLKPKYPESFTESVVMLKECTSFEAPSDKDLPF